MKVTLHPPFYILKAQEICWKCRTLSEVIAFAAGSASPHDEEDEVDDISPLILKDIEQAPPPFLIVAADQAGVDYHKRFSQAAGMEYYMNHCACGAPFGDYFLHNEPGHAFSPLDETDAAMIQIQEIEWSENMECTCWFAGWSSFSPFEHGTQEEEPFRIVL